MHYVTYLLLPFFMFCWAMDAPCKEDQPPHKFIIYAFIPWKMQPTKTDQQRDAYLLTFGIQPIKVIYENKYFINGKISEHKIKKLAHEHVLEPKTPISFDMEFGNRFKPETVIPSIKTIVQLYRRYNPNALIGIYATLPQNTYRWKPSLSFYDALNRKYSSISKEVDFISPSLYNYDGRHFEKWSKSAHFNMLMAKKYGASKPIIPYISPIYRIGPSDKAINGNLVEELSEEAMRKRLQTLYNLGASGCIIWASSQDRKQDGQIPQFDPNKAWGKAVVEFIRSKK